MFYLPPDEFWYLTAAKISVSFDDGASGVGTGFFIHHNENYFLVTARHVVDPKYLPPNKKRLSTCISIEISFQCVINPGTPEATLGQQKIHVTDPCFCYAVNDVDVAILKIQSNILPIVRDSGTTRPCSFSFHFLATTDDLSMRYAGEPVVFVGFPDNSPVVNEAQAEFHYPLLRQGVFAYPPIHGIEVQGELGANYGLLDSYAQSGFSGGPVISLQKGWPDGTWHPKEHYRPAKVVGLICGHYRSAQDRFDGGHSGLSFFARSTSIIELIQKLTDGAD